jgi:tetratricopeptide (TPR) repeat protein
LDLARRAVQAGANDALALCQAAHVFTSLTGETAEPIELVDRAVAINPNLWEAWSRSSWVRIAAGRLTEAIEHARKARSLSPLDPSYFIPLCAEGYSCFFLGRFEEAASLASQAMSGKNVPEMALRLRVIALANLDKTREMREAAKELVKRFPRFRIKDWSSRAFYRNPEQVRMIVAGMEKAGLPE